MLIKLVRSNAREWAQDRRFLASVIASAGRLCIVSSNVVLFVVTQATLQ